MPHSTRLYCCVTESQTMRMRVARFSPPLLETRRRARDVRADCSAADCARALWAPPGSSSSSSRSLGWRLRRRRRRKEEKEEDQQPQPFNRWGLRLPGCHAMRRDAMPCVMARLWATAPREYPGRRDNNDDEDDRRRRRGVVFFIVQQFRTSNLRDPVGPVGPRVTADRTRSGLGGPLGAPRDGGESPASPVVNVSRLLTRYRLMLKSC